MTNICQLQRGFFTLQNCDRPTVTVCSSCHRPVCQEHLSAASGFQYCIDCAQRIHQENTYGYDDDDWLYGFRHRYYTSYGYHPFSYGHQDYQSFNVRQVDEEYDDDSDIGDFSDS